MEARRAPAAFALLLVLAFIPALISAAYAVAGLLLVVWIVALRREGRSAGSLRSPFVFRQTWATARVRQRRSRVGRFGCSEVC